MYIGDKSAAKPMAIPPTNRAKIKVIKAELAPVAQEDTKKTKAANCNSFFLP